MQKKTGLVDTYDVVANFRPTIRSTVCTLIEDMPPTLQDPSGKRVVLGYKQVVLVL